MTMQSGDFRDEPWFFAGMFAWIGVCLFGSFALVSGEAWYVRVPSGFLAIAVVVAYAAWLRPSYVKWADARRVSRATKVRLSVERRAVQDRWDAGEPRPISHRRDAD